MNKNELENVLLLEPFKRYQYFLKKVADCEKLYSLASKEGDWASSEVRGYHLYPLWSAEEFVLNCKIDEWSDFLTSEYNLPDFLKAILPKIEKEGFLLNIFPVGAKTGFVVKPNEFIRDINEELENYL